MFSILLEDCYWSSVTSNKVNRDASFERFGYSSSVSGIQAGVERTFNNDWQAGVALGVESNSFSENDTLRAQSSGDGVMVGLSLKRKVADAGLVAASISGGRTSYTTTRRVNIFKPGIAEAKSSTEFFDARLRMAWQYEKKHFFMIPQAEFSLTSLHQNKFAETGIAGLGVASPGNTQNLASIMPALEMGWAYGNNPGERRSRISLGLGARYQLKDQLSLPFGFVDAPTGTPSALISNSIDAQSYSAKIGVETVAGKNGVISLGYQYEAGKSTQSHYLGGKFGIKF
ncbi:MAG: hypothetical protein COA85_02360 [Robiginitomaculum sp.]|nr:MAG: hypothetical protein COA85_02360 [Robiginitomaculum sp.]